MAHHERFLGRGASYASSRPDYPAAAIDLVTDGLVGGGVAVDIGAGTGISARTLGDRGLDVVALEPNAEMRRHGGRHPRVFWCGALGEALPLATGSVDLVLCAQSFHWLDTKRALAEFERVLAPRGRVALIWNIADENDPVGGGYWNITARSRAAYTPQTNQFFNEPLRGWADAVRHEFAHVHWVTRETLLGRARSSSYFPTDPDAAEPILAELEALHDRHIDADGRAPFGYRTHVWTAPCQQ